MYLCMDLNCDVVARDKGFQMLSETCRANEAVEIPPLSIVADYTKEDIEGFRRVNWTDTYGPGDQFNEIVIPSDEFFQGWLGTLVRTGYYYAMVFIFDVLMVTGCLGFRARLSLQLWVSKLEVRVDAVLANS